jgi:hypothetical protein
VSRAGIGSRLPGGLARISSPLATQVKGAPPTVQPRMKRPIASLRARTFSKLPGRIAWRVRMPNHVSTWFILAAEVGVK